MKHLVSANNLIVAFVFLCSLAMADGYRPGTELANRFVDEVATAEIAVFPTIVRSPYISRYSEASQQLAVELLGKSQLGTVRLADLQFYLGDPQGRSQFEFFQNGMLAIGEQLKDYDEDVDYIFVIEVLFPPAGSRVTEVFGIHVYVLDMGGNDVFSFLLNSHHESFSAAKLETSDDTAKGREKLAVKSTRVAISALKEQIAQLRKCIERSRDEVPKVAHAGVLFDFELTLPKGTDADGNVIGFSTFSDEKSSGRISTTASHPALPGESTGNRVLQVDLDVIAWAGVLHRVENEAIDRWDMHDWSAADGFSLWLYGRNTGTGLFIDLLDNRNSCSTIDDAERYTYEFFDDVAGWRLITVPFKDLARKEIHNGAPSDGLDLVNIHGWGLGAQNTDGPKTYYIDDFRLWSGESPAAAESGETIQHRLFAETRLSESSSRINLETDRGNKLVVEMALDLMCECARLTDERGFSYFKMDERAKLAGGRGTFRITFYELPPEGIPIVHIRAPGDPREWADPMTSVISAKDFTAVCNLMRGSPNQQE